MLSRFRTRRTLGVLCLLSLPGLVAASDEVNPFAEWDSLKNQTGITEASAAAQPSAGGASLEYFSPTATSVKEPGEAVKTPPRRPLKQISPGTPAAAPKASPQIASKAPAAGTAPAAASDTAWPASFQVHPSSAASQNSPAEGVVQAAAVIDSENQTENIELIAAEATDFDDTNPFAEFLKEQSAAAPPQTAASPAPGPAPVAAPALRETVVRSESPSRAYADGVGSQDTGPQSPSVTLQWVQHGDFNVGQECKCDLIIRNSSDSPVRHVIAEAVIPDGLQVIAASPDPNSTAGSALWTFEELAAGDSRRVELTVVPLGRGGMQLNAFVRFTGFAASVFTVKEPMLQLSVDGPAQVEVGQQGSYVVSVTNPGTGVARNVTIQAAIPEGLEHRRGSLLTIEVGTLNPGESRQAKLSVAAVQGGPQNLAVRATADGELTDQTTTNITVVEPQLSIAVHGPEQRVVGQQTDYEVVVVNDGNVASNNVRAKYRVPEGYEFISADRGGKFMEQERTVDWFVGTLKSGSSSSLIVTLRPTTAGAAVHQAGVVSDHGKVTVAEHSTTVEGVAELSLKLDARTKQAVVGDEAVFEVRIENDGSRAANGVGLSCELPFGLELLQAAGPSEYIAENGVLVFRSIPTLEPGQSAVFAIQTRCRREGTHNLRVRVASASITEPLIGEETTTAVSK
ncbi:MAG: hypothetical protein R3C19_00765 [Planctomycetaceae bacterium]